MFRGLRPDAAPGEFDGCGAQAEPALLRHRAEENPDRHAARDEDGLFSVGVDDVGEHGRWFRFTPYPARSPNRH